MRDVMFGMFVGLIVAFIFGMGFAVGSLKSIEVPPCAHCPTPIPPEGATRYCWYTDAEPRGYYGAYRPRGCGPVNREVSSDEHQ
jgi:hypothetical protein